MEFCERRRITQQAAIESLIEWIMKQEEEVQAMVLGQLQPKDYIVKKMLESLTAGFPIEPKVMDRETNRMGVLESKLRRRPS